MKIKTLFLTALSAAGLVMAGEPDADYTPGKFFYDGGLMIPGEEAPTYKKALFDKTGTTFGAELGLGYWAIDHQADGGYHSDNYLTMLWSRVDQRLIKDEMTGVEYQVNDIAEVYARLAWASSEYQRCRKEAMAGTTLRIVSSRPQDYLGVGFGIYKGADTGTRKLENEYEKVLEMTYRIKVNNHLSFAPYYQVYFNHAYRSVSTVSATGVQAHLSF